jgi:hypothetical protein
MAAAAMQAALAYNQAQAALDLENVLAAHRLTSQHGLAESRQTVAALAELTRQHKQVFSNFTTNATAQMVAATGQLPAEGRDQLAEQLFGSLNWNLSMQSQFYEGREEWIKAAAEALSLAERHNGQLWIEDGGLVVNSDALLTELQALVAIMDNVREREVAMFAERQAWIAAAAARLQAMA